MKNDGGSVLPKQASSPWRSHSRIQLVLWRIGSGPEPLFILAVRPGFRGNPFIVLMGPSRRFRRKLCIPIQFPIQMFEQALHFHICRPGRTGSNKKKSFFYIDGTKLVNGNINCIAGCSLSIHGDASKSYRFSFLARLVTVSK